MIGLYKIALLLLMLGSISFPIHLSARSNVPPVPSIDFGSLKKKAERGHGLAQYVLGSRLVRGEEIGQDCTLGLKWLKEASSNGVIEASGALSIIYRNGSPCGIKNIELHNKYRELLKGR